MSEAAEADELDGAAAERPILALLRAAKPRGLILWQNTTRVLSPTSQRPNYGWYPVASFNEKRPDWNLGGPWSMEFVEYVASLGLIGVWPHETADRAVLTKAGKAHLKAADGVAPKKVAA